MTTVGYGDFYPVTNPGRIVMVGVCLWGTVIISLMIVTVYNNLEMSQSEKRSFILLQKMACKHELNETAASVITIILKMRMQYRKQGASYFKTSEAVKLINKLFQIRPLMKKIKSEYKEMVLDQNTDPDNANADICFVKKELVRTQARINRNLRKVREVVNEIAFACAQMKTPSDTISNSRVSTPYDDNMKNFIEQISK